MKLKLIDDSAMDRLLNAIEALVTYGESEPGLGLTSAVTSIVPIEERAWGNDPDVQAAYTDFHRLLDEELNRIKSRGDSGNENRFVKTTKGDEAALRKAVFNLFSACHYNNWHYHAENR